MCDDHGYDDSEFDDLIEEDARLGKTREDILEEEFVALCDMGREHGLMNEDLMRVLNKIMNRLADENRSKFKLF